jgi:hypothetical protein
VHSTQGVAQKASPFPPPSLRRLLYLIRNSTSCRRASRCAHLGLGSGVGNNAVWQFAANVFIESFCVHVRNLIEFFECAAATSSTPPQDCHLHYIPAELPRLEFGQPSGRAAITHWGSTTKARRLIEGASFGPDALKAIAKSFDDAWLEIAGNFGTDPLQIESARLRLAEAVLSVAHEDSRDADVLRRAALQRMALDCRDNQRRTLAVPRAVKATCSQDRTFPNGRMCQVVQAEVRCRRNIRRTALHRDCLQRQ